MPLRSLLLLSAGSLLSLAAENPHFGIQVVDESTGRGVPLVQMETVNHASWWTDSAGWVAFNEPGLMDTDVYFRINSPGYEYAKDYFGNRGIKLHPRAGAKTSIKLPRKQIAERLYRITGQGIYRDSVLLGLKTPLARPVIDGLVMGQDTVSACPFEGKIYWFWGDTDRAAYPLGNFGASGASSAWPGRGGLKPSVGIDLEYFVNKEGFSKPVCEDSQFGQGLKWIEGAMTVRDDQGKERLAARVASGTGMEKTRDWRLGIFDKDKGTMEVVKIWTTNQFHDSAHPFHANVRGMDYVYLYPNYRVPARLADLKDLAKYEAFTCVQADGTVQRDPSGKANYKWIAGAERLHHGALQRLIRKGAMQRSDSWLQLYDLDSGAAVEAGRYSVFWNAHHSCWIMIASGKPGEIWYSEADAPTGPWVYARLAAEHGNYNFYNPTQHPFFDEEDGRFIYFEGTYTDAFSGAKAKTPRYDYNQIMYRLDLDDPRLRIPRPVYRIADGRLATAVQLRHERNFDQTREIAFFALQGAKPAKGEIILSSPALANCFGLSPNASRNSPLLEPLKDGRQDAAVWKSGLTALPIDWEAQEVRPWEKP